MNILFVCFFYIGGAKSNDNMTMEMLSQSKSFEQYRPSEIENHQTGGFHTSHQHQQQQNLLSFSNATVSQVSGSDNINININVNNEVMASHFEEGIPIPIPIPGPQFIDFLGVGAT